MDWLRLTVNYTKTPGIYFINAQGNNNSQQISPDIPEPGDVGFAIMEKVYLTNYRYSLMWYFGMRNLYYASIHHNNDPTYNISSIDWHLCHWKDITNVVPQTPTT